MSEPTLRKKSDVPEVTWPELRVQCRSVLRTTARTARHLVALGTFAGLLEQVALCIAT